MSVQEQLAKLESLLDRVRRNANKPRTVAAPVTAPVAPAVAAPAPVEDFAPMSGSPPTARVEYPAAGVPDVAPEPQAELEELDMMDSEIIEIDGAGKADDADAGAAVMLEEPVPESARRAAQALADEADLEPPVKTPPPESGRQIVAPPAPPSVAFKDEAEEADLTGSGDVDSLLEADLSGGPISKAPPGMPTMEQLGETVELEGADHPIANLELAVVAEQAEAEPDEMELALPKAGFSGGYDAELAPPVGASADLDRLRRAEAEKAAAPESLSAPSSLALSAPPVTAVASPPPTVTASGPTIIERPAVEAAHAAEIVTSPKAKLPETFLELLDASLGL